MVMEEIKCPKCGNSDRKQLFRVNYGKKIMIRCGLCTCLFDDSGKIWRDKLDLMGGGIF